MEAIRTIDSKRLTPFVPTAGFPFGAPIPEVSPLPRTEKRTFSNSRMFEVLKSQLPREKWIVIEQALLEYGRLAQHANDDERQKARRGVMHTAERVAGRAYIAEIVQSQNN